MWTNATNNRQGSGSVASELRPHTAEFLSARPARPLSPSYTQLHLHTRKQHAHCHQSHPTFSVCRPARQRAVWRLPRRPREGRICGRGRDPSRRSSCVSRPRHDMAGELGTRFDRTDTSTFGQEHLPVHFKCASATAWWRLSLTMTKTPQRRNVCHIWNRPDAVGGQF